MEMRRGVFTLARRMRCRFPFAFQMSFFAGVSMADNNRCRGTERRGSRGDRRARGFYGVSLFVNDVGVDAKNA